MTWDESSGGSSSTRDAQTLGSIPFQVSVVNMGSELYGQDCRSQTASGVAAQGELLTRSTGSSEEFGSTGVTRKGLRSQGSRRPSSGSFFMRQKIGA